MTLNQNLPLIKKSQMDFLNNDYKKLSNIRRDLVLAKFRIKFSLFKSFTC